MSFKNKLSFSLLHEQFYNLRISPSKKLIRYYTGDCSYEEYSYEDLRRECKNVAQTFALMLNVKESPYTLGICCDPGPAAVSFFVGALQHTSFIYLSPDSAMPELIDIMKRIPVLYFVLEEKYFVKISSILYDFETNSEITIFDRKYFIYTFKFKNNSGDTLINVMQYKIAYVICTSGTTGKPKLVFVPHSCIVPNIKDFKDIYGLSEDDIILSSSPLTFDPSIVDIFLCLSYGAHLIMLSPNVIRKPKCMESILRSNQISIWQLTPSLLRTLDQEFVKQYFATSKFLRIVAFGGEAFPSQALLKKWIDPHCRLKIFNLYGLTELSCWTSCQEVNVCEYLEKNPSENPISLGCPLTGTEMFLVDSQGKMISNGKGEIVIGGERNVCFILEKEKLYPQGKFIKTGDIGYTNGSEIFFLGRFDTVIKRNAHRISLSEIEVAALLRKEVFDCCSVFFENKIYLFVLMCHGPSDKLLIKNHLKEHLSSWKLPDEIYVVDDIPVNRHGKKDKNCLLEKLNKKSVTAISNNSNPAAILQNLWTETLSGYCPNEQDEFLSHGGTSLQAVELSEKIHQALACQNALTLQTILEKTFKDLCDLFIPSKTCTSENLSVDKRKIDKFSHKRQIETLSTSGNGGTFSHRNKRPSSNLAHLNFSYTNRSGYFCKNKRTVSVSKSNFISIKLNWKISLGKCIDASPLIIIFDNCIRIIIGSHSHFFYCIDSSGKEIWKISLPNRIEATASISVSGRAVFIGCYDGSLYSIDVFDGRILWVFKTGGMIKSTVIVDQETGWGIFGSYDKQIYCLTSDGNLVWRKRVTGGSIFSSPIIQNSYVYLASLDGYLICLDKYNGDLKWTRNFWKPIFSSLATITNGIVFGCTDGSVYCISSNSEVLWKLTTDGPIFSSPFVVELGALVLISIGSHDHSLYVLNNFGQKISRLPLSSPIYSSPFIVRNEEGLVIIACETKGIIHIFKVNIYEGKFQLVDFQTTFQLDGEVFSSPVFCNDVIYVGCRDDFLYSFKI